MVGEFRAAALGFVLLAATSAASAAEPAPAAGKEAVDRDRLAVHRIDIVDDKGVVRLSIAAPTPDPVSGGKVYRRAFPVSGIVLFDDKGNERGGLGVADIPGSAPVLALDHDNVDAIGWKVLPDGSVTFQMNARAPQVKDASGQVVANPHAATPVRIEVSSDGAPSITLADKQNRPRLRLTVTDEGFGALEFLDAKGRVLETIAPERSHRRRP